MIKKIILSVLIILISVAVLAVTFKGNTGTPIAYQYNIDSSVGTPFESTNSTSRFLLTKAIVERGSFFLTETEAKAAAPDLVYHNGKFISIFTPGVSFVAVPFYIVGEYFRMPQAFSFASTVIFSILNLVLIVILARRLGANLTAGLLGGLTFLFATNAFSYAQTLTQHHLSTSLILLSLILAFAKRNLLTNLLVGLLFGAGVLMDIPNAFMLLPVLLFAGFSNISVNKLKEKTTVAINFTGIMLVVGVLISLSAFGYYNLQTTGSATQIGQMIGRTNYFDTAEKKADDARRHAESLKNKDINIPFSTRVQLESAYILILSNQRGWFFYSPVLLLGIAGFYLAYKNKDFRPKASLLIVVVGMNIVIYSMFGDPWGGWSFGPRYLIPAASIMSVFLAVALTKYRRNLLFLAPFGALLIYGLYVNSLGVYTTAAIPPKVEAEALSTPVPYTYEYNRQLMEISRSSSFLYNAQLSRYVSLPVVVYSTVGIISVTVLLLLIINALSKERRKNE